MPTWQITAVAPALALLAPRGERQLDPRVHPDVIKLLADTETEGFGEVFVTFDQNDALCRAQGEGNDYFDACPDPAREFAQPLLARAYLDVIAAAMDHGKCDTETEEALRETLQLPDTSGRAIGNAIPAGRQAERFP